MKYQDFLEKIILEIKRHMGHEVLEGDLEVEEWRRGRLYGIALRTNKEAMSPVLVLNDYYRKYQSGVAQEDILEEVVSQLKVCRNMKLPEAAQFYNFHEIKDQIIFRFMRIDGNEALLEEVPYVPFLDLAIVFYLYLGDHEGQAVALIHNEYSHVWHVHNQILFELARQNTPRLLPEVVADLNQLLPRIVNLSEFDKDSKTLVENEQNSDCLMYLLTNSMGIYGAAAILYDGVVKQLSNEIEKDLFLLPSSVHEFLAIPYSPDIFPDELRTMVKMVNETEVSEEEILSDHVYIYSRKDNSISIAA